MFSPGAAICSVHLRRWTDSAQFGVRVRAQNLFSVKQGRRACGLIRTSPHPVIPIRRANPELVGFLLHPISRSETWRRLMFLQVRGPKLLARSSISGSPIPGGRVDLEESRNESTTP